MNEQTQGPLIFRTRRGAVIALSVGVLLILRDFRYLFEIYVPGHTSWLTRYRFSPTLFDIILHLWCSALFAGALVYLLRRTRGGERVFLAIFVCVAVLAPLSDIRSLAQHHVYSWIATILESGLVPSALWMYKTLPSHSPRTEAK